MPKPACVFRYRIRTWRDYTCALINRGRLTVEFDEHTIQPAFAQLFQPDEEYHATGIVLVCLAEDTTRQLDLFEYPAKIEKFSRVYQVMDHLRERFGKHTVFLPVQLSRSLLRPTSRSAGRHTGAYRASLQKRDETQALGNSEVYGGSAVRGRLLCQDMMDWYWNRQCT